MILLKKCKILKDSQQPITPSVCDIKIHLFIATERAENEKFEFKKEQDTEKNKIQKKFKKHFSSKQNKKKELDVSVYLTTYRLVVLVSATNKLH